MNEVLDDQLTDDNAPVIEKNKATYRFKNIDVNTLAEDINQLMLGKGYKLEVGNSVKGSYGKGSSILRVLFGAFAKRFEWNIEIHSQDDFTVLEFSKQAKGYMGGAIGVSQVNKEYKVITEDLTKLHASNVGNV